MAGERLTLKAELFCASVRDGTHDSPKPASGGKYLVTSRHIIGGKVDLSNAYLISQEDFDNINKRSKVDKWDVLISMIGTVGEVCLVKEEPDFAIKNIGLFKAKGEIEGKWLYYYLQSPQAKQHMLEQSRGTTQAYIPLGSLRVFPILIQENKKEMQAIAHILGTLDDKIELNRKMNKTLEEMARAIFKSWFVDFDPLHAKAAVRRDHPNWTNAQVSRAALPNLSPEIAELFPDALEDSDLGEIPKGWNILPLSDVCKRITDGSHFSPKSVDVGRPMASVKDMRDWGFELSDCRRISEDNYQELVRNDCRPLAGDVLIAKDGSYLKHIFVVEDDLDLVILSSIAILRPNEKLDSHLLAFSLKGD